MPHLKGKLICRLCNNLLPNDQFSETGKKRHECRKCKKIYNRIYNLKNKDKLKEWRKRDRDKRYANEIKRVYGISIEEYHIMCKLSDNKCWICEKINKRRKLNIDHCHQTGKIRGVLCDECNKALGLINDNITTLFKMIKYLRGESEFHI